MREGPAWRQGLRDRYSLESGIALRRRNALLGQQDQATAGIAENIGSTAQDAEIASDTIHRVIGITNEAGSAAGSVSDAAEKLAEQAEQLDSQVRTFLQRIRQAA